MNDITVSCVIRYSRLTYQTHTSVKWLEKLHMLLFSSFLCAFYCDNLSQYLHFCFWNFMAIKDGYSIANPRFNDKQFTIYQCTVHITFENWLFLCETIKYTRIFYTRSNHTNEHQMLLYLAFIMYCKILLLFWMALKWVCSGCK